MTIHSYTWAGAEEGAFAWLTLNYLLGFLGKSEDDTIAAIDLGGGSVQQAYALTAAEAKTAPQGYVSELAGGGRRYHVYVHRCWLQLAWICCFFLGKAFVGRCLPVCLLKGPAAFIPVRNFHCILLDCTTEPGKVTLALHLHPAGMKV